MKARYLMYPFVLAAVLAVAACGGSSNNSPEPTEEMVCTDAGGRWNSDMTCTTADGLAMEVTEMQRMAINNAITAAETVVAGLTDDASDAAIGSADTAVAGAKSAVSGADNVPDDEKAAFNTAIAVVERNLATRKMSIMAARDKADMDMKAAMAKTGKALHAALGPPNADTDPPTYALANIGAPGLSSDGLAIDATAGAGALPNTGDGSDPGSVTLKAGDSAGSLSSWMGMDYTDTTGTGAMKVTNDARVYTNQGPAKSVSFADAGYPAVITDGADKGYMPVGSTEAEVARVMATAFMHSGQQTHPIPDRSNALYLRGTYGGAPGEYRCTGTCSSISNGSGSPSVLGGTWHFKPDAGAMVSRPDDQYLYFGWWVSKGSDGMPTAASAFAGRFGAEATDDGLDVVDLTDDTLTGSATYVGNAAGKFAITNVLEGTGNGGHFTADAMLEAKFNGETNPGVTGTIDNFMLNDTESVDWSVKLNNGGLAATGITAPTENPTVWSINGNPAMASGTWSGTMYDEMPGNAPDGDGSNIPTTVTGTFYSEFSSIGRMVGAFGAAYKDKDD